MSCAPLTTAPWRPMKASCGFGTTAVVNRWMPADRQNCVPGACRSTAVWMLCDGATVTQLATVTAPAPPDDTAAAAATAATQAMRNAIPRLRYRPTPLNGNCDILPPLLLSLLRLKREDSRTGATGRTL